MEPVSTLPSYCGALDTVTDDSVRAWGEMGETLAIGPTYMLEAGGYVAALRCSDAALKVFDMASDWRGTFASWAAARASLLALAMEYEGGMDLQSI